MNKPVLLITFNRPNYTKIVLEALKKAEVKNLYVFKDGPRPFNEEDKKASKEIENIINKIDWVDNLHVNYLNNNLGCGYGPYTAISWAFQNEDELIILEDDCVPTVSFFKYCSFLLDKYKNNNNVRHISGRSVYSEHEVFHNYDYIFTQYAPTLGWATWKRVWENFCLNEKITIKPFFKNGGFTYQFSSKKETNFFNNFYYNRKSPLKEMLHSWDYQFSVFSRINGALAIAPAKNLIKYIGLEGTHYSDSFHYEIDAIEDFTVEKEPIEISFLSKFEQDYFNKFINVGFKYKVKSFLNKIKIKIVGRPDFD